MILDSKNRMKTINYSWKDAFANSFTDFMAIFARNSSAVLCNMYDSLKNLYT